MAVLTGELGLTWVMSCKQGNIKINKASHEPNARDELEGRKSDRLITAKSRSVFTSAFSHMARPEGLFALSRSPYGPPTFHFGVHPPYSRVSNRPIYYIGGSNPLNLQVKKTPLL